MRKVIFDIPYTYRGETRLLSEWGRELGINYTTLCARVKRGVAGDNLFEPVQPYRLGRIGKTYEIDGHKGILRELAKIYDMSYTTVVGRLNRGYSLEDALKKPRYFK